ncbi:MAG: serine hydrolase, partial [Gemmatimonadetes bacterium]|nr:serine hydrolase [Gemmatimonadota bacterium]
MVKKSVVLLWLGASLLAGAPLQGQAALESSIRARLDSLDARSSLYAKHLPSGQEIAIRADQPMNALSVIKIPVMVLAYREAEARRLNLDERRRIQPEDLRRGSGLLQTFAPGLEPTYRD